MHDVTSTNPIHSSMTVWASFRTMDPAPDLPPELRGAVFVNEDIGRYFPDVKTEIRIALHIVGPDRATRALRKCGVRVVRHFMEVSYSEDFWNDPPADCVGALLAPDGHVALCDSTLYWRIVPLSEPLYTIGRPEADSEHARYKPHALSHCGGIQVVGDELLAALLKLGAKGQTAPMTYRGFNKKSYDTVQPGFRRFLPMPEYEMSYASGIEFLPEAVPRDFGICSMLRSRKDPPSSPPGIPQSLADDRWYDIALAREVCFELLGLRKRVLLKPMFGHDGVTHRWFSEFTSAVAELTRSS